MATSKKQKGLSFARKMEYMRSFEETEVGLPKDIKEQIEKLKVFNKAVKKAKL